MPNPRLQANPLSCKSRLPTAPVTNPGGTSTGPTRKRNATAKCLETKQRLFLLSSPPNIHIKEKQMAILQAGSHWMLSFAHYCKFNRIYACYFVTILHPCVFHVQEQKWSLYEATLSSYIYRLP